MLEGLRTLGRVVATVGLVTSLPSEPRDPDEPCPEEDPECWDGPPGPMPVVHARLGETVTFHCYAYSPCAEVILDLEQPVDFLRVSLVSELAGGYGGNVIPPDDWPNPYGHQYGNGYGFNDGGPQKFDHLVPFESTQWAFSFAPMSGQHGGDIAMLVEVAPDSARAAWG